MDGLFHTTLLGALAVDEVQQVGKCLVRIINADERRRHFLFRCEILADQYGRSLGRIDEVGVFGICQKGQAARSGFLNLCIVVNHGIGIAFNRSVNHFRKLLGSYFHDVVIY